MKLILSLTAVFTLVANLALAAPPSVHARKMECPPDALRALPFFRADKDQIDHLYSTDALQIEGFVSKSGYKANGSVGKIFSKPLSGTIPLHRLYNIVSKDHTYTINIADMPKLVNQGYHSEGIAGYILGYPCQIRGYRVVQLYRLVHSSKEPAHSLLTTDVSELPAGYVVDNSVGYVLT